MGTSSMRRKSKQEELRARALGSEMDNEAEASKDILWGARGDGLLVIEEVEGVEEVREEGGGDWSWRCECGLSWTRGGQP